MQYHTPEMHTNNSNRYCVIMAGGTSHSYWPFSRDSRPKQFMDMSAHGNAHGNAFIKKTYDRFKGIIPEENILVVTLARYASLVSELIPELPENNLLLEPYSRNTAPCMAYASYKILKRNPDAVIAATPADHVILDEEAFRNDVAKAMDYAESNPCLMTIGITPSRPSTSYGYIQVTGKGVTDSEPIKVKTFVEKPDIDLAEVFCKSGEFFWNSGIFIGTAALMKEEIETYTPEVTALFKGWETSLDTEDETLFLDRAYSDCPKVSIDYGVMEKTERACLYPGHFDWADIDTWNGMYKHQVEKNNDGNAILAARTLIDDDKGCLVVSNNQKKVYAIKGLKDFVVIDSDDALLICPRGDKEYKDLVSGLAMPDFEDVR